MTLRTSSATRFSVVSRSSVVFTTSATSSRRGSTSEARSVCEAVIFTSYIIAADGSGSSRGSICNWVFVIGYFKLPYAVLTITNYNLAIKNFKDFPAHRYPEDCGSVPHSPSRNRPHRHPEL